MCHKQSSHYQNPKRCCKGGDVRSGCPLVQAVGMVWEIGLLVIQDNVDGTSLVQQSTRPYYPAESVSPCPHIDSMYDVLMLMSDTIQE